MLPASVRVTYVKVATRIRFGSILKKCTFWFHIRKLDGRHHDCDSRRRRHHGRSERHRPCAGDRAGGRGCDLALADCDEAGLKALAAEIGAQRKISLHRLDVGEADDIAQFASDAIAAHPALNILLNNAGVALLGQFEEIDQAQMEWLFDINFWGVVHGTRASQRTDSGLLRYARNDGCG
jgi:hypothetical protein